MLLSEENNFNCANLTAKELQNGIIKLIGLWDISWKPNKNRYTISKRT